MAAAPIIPFNLALKVKTLAADTTHSGVCPKPSLLDAFVDELFAQAGINIAKYDPAHVALVRGEVTRTVLAHCGEILPPPGPPTVFVTMAPVWWGLAAVLGGVYLHKKEPGLGKAAIVAGSTLMIWGGFRVGMAA